MENEVELVRELILKNKKPSYQTTNKKEVIVRCPYCGDSKNLSSAHFYIEMMPPFKFHCKKCETGGVLTNQTLRDLMIYDSELNSSIISANKNYKQNNMALKNLNLKNNKRKLINNVIYSETSNKTVSYFNNRYNTNHSQEFIVSKFRVVTDPIEFFKNNGIRIPFVSFDFSNAIGFISSDNSHIVFRDITGQQKLRYYNLSVVDSSLDGVSSKIYNISSSIDIMQPKTRLVMTEGIFDIVGVYQHFYQNTPNEENSIFSAACGKGFNSIILSYIRKGFLSLDIEIYSDGDVDIEFYKRLKNSSEYIKNKKITIYYNSLYDKKTKYGKDFGVPSCDIKLKKIIL